ncbi:hypothetical protein [Anaeromyxobacter oryzae]|uniref:DUF4760 domain-containing protein n=1 Tax=Anaeromyxobacter oryzae TaxID=2918170 RepID=A0ABN6MVF9_9BACT|nr:hypothetical protein [Anaeromyxobacter oryzae]BDG04952.1 hypothetical protein AMOR_39480 [Anaeromyxobacter oryzae]
MPPANPWFDFWQKLALIVADKVVLGLAVLLVGFWFQRRLEQHRRNQAVFTEHAKMAVAAFNRVLSIVHDIRSTMSDVNATALTERAKTRLSKRASEMMRVLMEDRYLVGPAFFSAGMRLACVARRSTVMDDDFADFLAHTYHVEDLLKVMLASRPRFAQLPSDERHFAYPTIEEASKRAGVTDTWPVLDDYADPEPIIPEGARKRALEAARLSGGPSTPTDG